jgi:hypothetical protein
MVTSSSFLVEKLPMEDLQLPKEGTEERCAWEGWAFWAVLALQILPVWLFHYFPSHDGPIHIYNCLVLKDIFTSQPGIAQTYYTLNPQFPPNVLAHVLLTALTFIASPLVAEKLFLTIYALTLGLSARYALASIRRQSLFLSFLILPIVFNFTVYMGFYNFIIAIPIFFWTFGYWRRNIGDLRWPKVAVLAVAFLVMYLAHLFVVAFAFLVISIIVLEAVICSRSFRFWRVSAFRTVYAMLPAAALAAYYVVKRSAPTQYNNPLHSLRDLFHDNSIVSFYAGETAIAIAFYLFIAVATAWQIRNASKRGDAWKPDGNLIALAVGLFLYIVASNEMIGGGYTRIRLLLFVVFTNLFWLAQFHYSPRFIRFTRVLSITMALSLALFHASAYRMLNPYLAEYAAAGSVMAAGKSMLALNYSVKGRNASGGRISRRAGPFRHADAYAGIDRRLALIDNYEASSLLFPLVFVPGQNPYPPIVDLYDEPPCADLDAYVAARRRPIDYVLIWFPEAQEPGNVCVERVRNHLRRNYTRIYSSPRNLAHVYQIKDELVHHRANTLGSGGALSSKY